MRTACIQTSVTPNPADNVSGMLDRIAEAAAGGAELIVLQELFATRYFCQTEDHRAFDLAEPIPDGPTAQTLAAAAEHHGIVVVGSFFERRAPGLYHNTAVVFDADGTVAGVYRKMHIPDDPLYYEKFYFTPGDAEPGFGAVDTAVGRVGVLVCWDQWFPEAARLTAMAGAEILCVPTAIGWHPAEKKVLGDVQLDAWMTVQRGHAIANGVFLAAANRVGFEPTPKHETQSSPEDTDNPSEADGIEFYGNSFIAGPDGALLGRAGRSEEILIADCNPAAIETQRRGWPFLRDRRVDAYGKLTRRWG